MHEKSLCATHSELHSVSVYKSVCSCSSYNLTHFRPLTLEKNQLSFIHVTASADSSSRISPPVPEPLALPVLSRMHVSCPKPSMHNEVSCSCHRGSTCLTNYRVLTGPSPDGCVKLFVRINRSISLLAAAAVPPTLATRPAIMNMSIIWVGKKAVSTPVPLTTKGQYTLRRCASRNMGATERSVQNV